jgi:DNA-binding transcriptional LysR family regulator
VLQPFSGRSRPVSLIYPHGRLLPSRVRAFVDFLLEQAWTPAPGPSRT